MKFQKTVAFKADKNINQIIEKMQKEIGLGSVSAVIRYCIIQMDRQSNHKKP